jgi:mono/diheme cytochrome c family protein
MKKFVIAFVLLVVSLPLMAQSVDLGTDAQRANGKVLYDKFCSQCHGVDGDGRGIALPFVRPQPRDFTSGKYKIRQTPNGQLPLHQDLVNLIRKGMPYTTMPAWPRFSDAEVDDIVYYLKTFNEQFADPEAIPQAFPIGSAPAATPDSLKRGREIYEAQGCKQCHGDLGRGDGPSAPTLTDSFGFYLPSADLTKRWTFRGGASTKDIYRTFSTGLNGTPMPSYAEAVSDEDRWNLANYVASLSPAMEPPYGNLVQVDCIESIDVEDPEATFATAKAEMFPIIGQIVEPGRNFAPFVTAVTVDAVYDQSDIAIRVRWNDMRADTSGTNDPTIAVGRFDSEAWLADHPAGASAGGEDEDPFGDDGGDPFASFEEEEETDPFADVEVSDEDFWGEEEDDSASSAGASEWSDSVAIQIPSRLPTGIEKPYFIFGDSSNSVDLWFADLGAGNVTEYLGKGSSNMTAAESTDVEATWSYNEGEWSVVFKRPRISEDSVNFAEEITLPLAVSVWDGFNEERGTKRGLTQWMFLYLEPETEISATGPVVRAFGLTLLIELLLAGWIAWKFGRPKLGGENV